MTSLSDRWSLVLRALYYLLILLAVLAIASHRLGIRPSFVYQGF